MPAPYSSLAIANEFIRRSTRDHQPVTQMQIQKLVYLAHGWCLAGLETSLVEDQFEAWAFGPVVPKLYLALSNHGRAPVRELISWGDGTPFYFDDDDDDEDDEEAFEEILVDEKDVIDLVWETYGKYPAFHLSALTHEPGTPWSRIFEHGRNRPIENAQIKDYFNELLEPEPA